MAEGSKVGAAYVELTGDNSKYKRTMKESQGILQGFGNTATRILGGLGVSLGMVGLAHFGVSSVKEFAASEDALFKLAAATKLHGGNVTDLMGRYVRFTNVMQATTLHTDEEVAAAMQLGLTLGIGTERIEEATRAAIGLSSITGDLHTAMMLVGRAANGSTNMLSRYGIRLDENMTPQQKFNALLERGSALMGMQEVATESLSGRLHQTSKAWGEAKEALGGWISKAIDLPAILQSLTKYFTGLAGGSGELDKLAAALDKVKAGELGAAEATEKETKALKDQLSLVGMADSWERLLRSAFGDVGAGGKGPLATVVGAATGGGGIKGGGGIGAGKGGIRAGSRMVTGAVGASPPSISVGADIGISTGASIRTDGAVTIGLSGPVAEAVNKVRDGASAMVGGVQRLARILSGDPGMGIGLGGAGAFTDRVN